MRIAYLDCFAGLSGDMFLGALVEAGLDPQILHEATAALNIGAQIKIETVDRNGISCTKVHVLEDGKSAEAATSSHEHTHRHEHEHAAGHNHEHAATASHTHDHSHSHSHAHGRSLSAIRKLIQETSLPAVVKNTAINAFELLGASEARIHNVPVEDIHFHEVGAVDAIVDIVSASAGMHALNIERWYSSPLNVGGGMVDCAHGRFPVPAPATADLLRNVPTYSADIMMELVTPTGAALLRALIQEKGVAFGTQPAMRVQHIGYGAGSRNPKNFPNALRLSIGDANETSHEHSGHTTTDSITVDTVTVLETALDDLSPQILAHVTEMALQAGAFDVMCTAVQMKKGRLGTLITILADDAQAPALERLLLRETSTLGVRMRHERRSCIARKHAVVQTAYGDIRMKIGYHNDEELNAAPEFEDCRSAAIKHNIPVKIVLQAAIAAYRQSKP